MHIHIHCKVCQYFSCRLWNISCADAYSLDAIFNADNFLPFDYVDWTSCLIAGWFLWLSNFFFSLPTASVSRLLCREDDWLNWIFTVIKVVVFLAIICLKERGVMPADYEVQVQTSPVLVWFMGWTTEEHWRGSLLEIKTSTRTFQRTLNW